MLTYSFENIGSDHLYEYLYRRIKEDILARRLDADEKLPSKRSFAKHLGVSLITVENAYAQLAAEGYVYSIPKSGYFVAQLEQQPAKAAGARENTVRKTPRERSCAFDFVDGAAAGGPFPFSVWSRLLREVLASEEEASLLSDTSSGGARKLRCAIAAHLYQFRGLAADPDQIIVGAGTQYLYGILVQLLGRDQAFAVEDPGYPRLGKILDSCGVRICAIPMDASGVVPELLEESGADILHITPSHQFPTGIVMPISRRYELLSWAAKDSARYLIEDDYDCEFRLYGKPIPPLKSIDVLDQVIYMNTFSKSLAPTFRISYMVLPKALAERFYEKLGFYSCSVSNFEQLTLAHFLGEGYFEKHINRMRSYYRVKRDELISALFQSPLAPYLTVREENAGLHFLLEVKTDAPDEELTRVLEEAGVRIFCVSQYCRLCTDPYRHTLVVNYSSLENEKMAAAAGRLSEALLPLMKKC